MPIPDPRELISFLKGLISDPRRPISDLKRPITDLRGPTPDLTGSIPDLRGPDPESKKACSRLERTRFVLEVRVPFLSVNSGLRRINAGLSAGLASFSSASCFSTSLCLTYQRAPKGPFRGPLGGPKASKGGAMTPVTLLLATHLRGRAAERRSARRGITDFWPHSFHAAPILSFRQYYNLAFMKGHCSPAGMHPPPFRRLWAIPNQVGIYHKAIFTFGLQVAGVPATHKEHRDVTYRAYRSATYQSKRSKRTSYGDAQWNASKAHTVAVTLARISSWGDWRSNFLLAQSASTNRHVTRIWPMKERRSPGVIGGGTGATVPPLNAIFKN